MTKMYYFIITVLITLIVLLLTLGFYFFTINTDFLYSVKNIFNNKKDFLYFQYDVYINDKFYKSFYDIEEAYKIATDNSNSCIKKHNGNVIVWNSKIEIEQDYYKVYVDHKLLDKFLDFESAKKFGDSFEKSGITKNDSSEFIWDNFPSYAVFINKSEYIEFYTYYEALSFAKSKEWAYLYYKKNNALLWHSDMTNNTSAIIKDVKIINQLPELERGCEVTSLAMLLNYYGKDVTKLELAKEIKKDLTKMEIKNNKIYYGNPQEGFVGDIYTKSKPGLGVYNEPVFQLLKKYIDKKALNITGTELEDVFTFIDNNVPVWTIINTSYKKLPENSFVTWHTKDGKIKITYKEHSVLIIGYDKTKDLIFIKDPLNNVSSVKTRDFKEAYNQMGKQAVTYTP